METIQLAKQLYDAYCEGVGGIAFNGDKLPTSEQFFADESKQKQVGAWIKAAEQATSCLDIKGAFGTMHKMNLLDEKNKTRHISLCPDLVSVNKNGNNGTVTMGVPGGLAQELALGTSNKKPFLIVLDMDEYNKY